MPDLPREHPSAAPYTEIQRAELRDSMVTQEMDMLENYLQERGQAAYAEKVGYMLINTLISRASADTFARRYADDLLVALLPHLQKIQQLTPSDVLDGIVSNLKSRSLLLKNQ